MSDAIRIVKATTHKPKPKDADLGFGNIFTDHMFVADFQEEKGWYDPRVEPYGPIPLDPAAAVLHYAQAIFDGLKAFRGADGKVRLFRPQKHLERMSHSAGRGHPLSTRSGAPLDRDLSGSSETGAEDGRHSRYAPDHHRERGIPRRAPGQGTLLRHPLACGAYYPEAWRR